jgi:ankyrin repeat protein
VNLQAAVERKDSGLVKSLLDSGADPNGGDQWGRPLLIRAIGLGQSEIVKLLIASGADINATITSSDNSTPLHWAAGGGVCAPNLEIAKLLLMKGAEVDAKTKVGNTPLIWAAKSEDERAVAVAELLLAHGADLNCQGFDGIPLQYAKDEGTAEMVELLRRKRRDSLPANRNLGSRRCPTCESADVEQTDILPKREVWHCNACQRSWSIWYPPYEHRNEQR